MQKAVFFHIPKTGGRAVHGALEKLLPEGWLSPHIHFLEDDANLSDLVEWPVISGHLSGANLHLLPDLDERLVCTIVREPVACVSSHYHYWRMLDKESPDRQLPWVQLAHEVSLREFIRNPVVEAHIWNSQSWFLGADFTLEPSLAARNVLAPFSLVGCTDHIPSFLGRLMTEIGVQPRIPIEEALASTPKGESVKIYEFSEDDLAYARERSLFDQALYDLAAVIAFPILELGRRIDLTDQSDGPAVLVKGWAYPEPRGIWSEGRKAKIRFRPSAKPTTIVIEATPLVSPSHPEQCVEISINDVPATTARLTSKSSIVVPVPETVRGGMASNGLLSLGFKFPNAVRPYDLGLNDDKRVLALALHALTAL